MQQDLPEVKIFQKVSGGLLFSETSCICYTIFGGALCCGTLCILVHRNSV